MSTPRKILTLVVFLCSALILAFGSDWRDSLGALFQSISPRPGSGPASYTLSSGLVGYWTFDGKDMDWSTQSSAPHSIGVQ
jgi:hypothetical protein